jgi:hypothetical protein
MTTTDTPRTDAIEFRHCPPQPKELLKKHQDAYALSRELERELAASQAEVAKLNHQLLKTESDLLQSQDINSFLDTEFRIACKRAEKAEAEVERLKLLLSELLILTEKNYWNSHNYSQIKEAINQTDK